MVSTYAQLTSVGGHYNLYSYVIGRSRMQALKKNPVAYAIVKAKRAEAAR
jgi:hypothetical protein